MNWLTRYATGRKKERKPRRPKVIERIRIVDPGFDESGAPVSVYWEGSMPLNELLKFDPQARCRTTREPRTKRLIAWWGTPGILTLLVFAGIYLSSPEPLTVLPLAFAGAVFLGAPVGLLAAWIIVKYWLPIEAWWHFMRVHAKDAQQYKLSPRTVPSNAAPDKYVLMGIVPRPLMAEVEDDSDELEREIQNLLWQREELRLGEGGWATNNFLRGMGAARSREELLKAGVVAGPRPTLEKPGPDQRGGPR